MKGLSFPFLLPISHQIDLFWFPIKVTDRFLKLGIRNAPISIKLTGTFWFYNYTVRHLPELSNFNLNENEVGFDNISEQI